jgi:adhesin HecA-like repeat protein
MVERDRNLDKRMNWFDRQFVRAQDFVDGDDYQLDRRRRHVRLLHSPGVAEGLRVNGAVGDTTVAIEAGTAIDAQGREIVVLVPPPPLALPGDVASAEVYLLYEEALDNPSTDPGVAGYTRIHEIPKLAVRKPGESVPTSPSRTGAVPGVLLANLELDGGKLAAVPDNSVRTLAGAVIGDVAVVGVTLRRAGRPPGEWPRITSSEQAAEIRFLTGGPAVEHMRILADGSVAIGTTSPLGAALTLEHPSVPLAFRDADQAVTAGGLWRMGLDGGTLRLQTNTAPAGDFSAVATPLALKDGRMTLGAGGNAVFAVRHIDGKSHLSDDDDGLFLNWATDKDVHIGSDAHQNSLYTHGQVAIRRFPPDDTTAGLATLSLVTRGGGGSTVTWNAYTAAVGGGFGVEPGAFEIWSYEPAARRFQILPNGDTILTPSGGWIRVPDGGTISAGGRLHLTADRDLFLLPKTEDVYVSAAWGGSANLHVDGQVLLPDGGTISAGGRLHLTADRDLFLLPKASDVFVSAAWGGSANLHVDGEVLHKAARTRIVGFDAAGNHWVRSDDQDQQIWFGYFMPARQVVFAVTVAAPQFLQTSDARLKKRVRPVGGVLDKLAGIRGVSFEPRRRRGVVAEAPEGADIGVIAQEVETVFPELVSTVGEREYKAVNYGGLTAVLIEAVKELRAELDALRERVAALEGSS